ncbi:MAG: T9SS type A sorting domain-containing protein [Saprospiraceae bacterium]|nr:T9SS type A sorting domain-containing protein [Saprospiraceae bacterium]
MHQFDSNGVYRVCLIVNNRHGADTLCRTLHIGTLSTDEYAEHSQVNLQTFPQPAHSDLIVNVLDYIPQKMSCTLLDIQGQALLHQRLFGGSNVLNVRSVPAGMYLLKISEINRRDRFEKILIEH